MHDTILNSDEPLTFLESSQSPIYAKKENKASYQIPPIQRLFQTLQRFSEGQQAIALITGPISSGKTTLLKYFQSECRFECKLIPGFSKIDFEELLTFPFVDPKIRTEDLTTEALALALSDMIQPCIFVIDDADFLSLETLQTLLAAFGKQASTRCKLILAGESALAQRVEMLLVKNDLSFPLSPLSLEPLTLKETEEFLTITMGQDAAMKRTLLNKKSLAKIYALSEGYVGRINRVALQLSSEGQKVSATKGRLSMGRASWVDSLLGIGIILLLVVVGIRVYQQFYESNQQNEPSIAVHAEKKLVAPASLAHAQPEVVFAEANTASYIASIEDLPEELVANASSEAVSLPEPLHLTTAKQVSGKEQLKRKKHEQHKDHHRGASR